MSELQLALPGVIADSAIEWVWCEETDEVTDATRFVHTTVMKDEVVAALAPHDGGVYVDATLGAGGHAEAILEAAPTARVVGFDRDGDAILASAERIARHGSRFTAVHAPFGTVYEELAAREIPLVNGLCADLGVSSPQLDEPMRGMSFRREGPLDMRMDRESGQTALELMTRLDDDALANVLYRYGEEHRSRRIARSIKRSLREGDLQTTLDLRRAIVRAVGPVRVGGVDPATRTFQALRIAVNHELEELECLLAQLPRIVAPGGVAAILSFHSLEDRLVKRAFHDREVWEPLWKKPRIASDDETNANPRARSAKLRAARRIGWR
jgi:16S rRNA (cytosine1402-N4)-methyltransferase